MNIYFACSIRGGRQEVDKYESIVEYLKTIGNVLTEHIGYKDLHLNRAEKKSDEYIYNKDVTFLNQSNLVVAEVTRPSLGVGYELAYAEKKGIPTFCLFRTDSEFQLSAMIAGNPYFKVIKYTNIEDGIKKLSECINKLQEVV